VYHLFLFHVDIGRIIRQAYNVATLLIKKENKQPPETSSRTAAQHTTFIPAL